MENKDDIINCFEEDVNKTEQKLINRCKTLAEMIKVLRPIYNDKKTSEGQKGFMETVVGAAIWYLGGQKNKLWTETISLKAIEMFHPESGENKPKLCEEHAFPRKIAGKELLEKLPNIEDAWKRLKELYETRYGKVTFVTKKENDELKPYQRKGVFNSESDAYDKCGIKPVHISWETLKKIKKRDKITIDKLLSQHAGGQ